MQVMIDIECKTNPDDYVLILSAIGGFLAKLSTYDASNTEHTFNIEIAHNSQRMIIVGSSVSDDDGTQYITVERALRLIPAPRRLALCS